MKSLLCSIFVLFSVNGVASTISTSDGMTNYLVPYGLKKSESVEGSVLVNFTMEGIGVVKRVRILGGGESPDSNLCVKSYISNETCSFSVDTSAGVTRSKRLRVMVYSSEGRKSLNLRFSVDNTVTLDETLSNIKVIDNRVGEITSSLGIDFGFQILDKPLFKKIYLRNDGLQSTAPLVVSFVKDSPAGLAYLSGDLCSGKILKARELCSVSLIIQANSGLIPLNNNGVLKIGVAANDSVIERNVSANIRSSIKADYSMTRYVEMGGASLGDYYKEEFLFLRDERFSGIAGSFNEGAIPSLTYRLNSWRAEITSVTSPESWFAGVSDYITAPASFASLPTGGYNVTTKFAQTPLIDKTEAEIYSLFEEEIDFCLFFNGIFRITYQNNLDATKTPMNADGLSQQSTFPGDCFFEFPVFVRHGWFGLRDDNIATAPIVSLEDYLVNYGIMVPVPYWDDTAGDSEASVLNMLNLFPNY